MVILILYKIVLKYIEKAQLIKVKILIACTYKHWINTGEIQLFQELKRIKKIRKYRVNCVQLFHLIIRKFLKHLHKRIRKLIKANHR